MSAPPLLCVGVLSSALLHFRSLGWAVVCLQHVTAGPRHVRGEDGRVRRPEQCTSVCSQSPRVPGDLQLRVWGGGRGRHPGVAQLDSTSVLRFQVTLIKKKRFCAENLKPIRFTAISSKPTVITRRNSCSPLNSLCAALRNHQKREYLAQRVGILHSTKKKCLSCIKDFLDKCTCQDHLNSRSLCFWSQGIETSWSIFQVVRRDVSSVQAFTGL